MVIKSVYTPNHRSICDALNAFCVWIFSLISGNKQIYDSEFNAGSSATIIGFFFVLLGTLIFTETITFSIFNLNTDVKYEVYLRGKQDKKLVQKDLAEIESYNVSFDDDNRNSDVSEK